MTDPPGFVFVTGAARSGTTAMTELLNAHPSICIGVERYKYFNRPYSPRLFQEERFFSFQTGETNILPANSEYWARYYQAMRAKWPGATVRGDKLATRRLDGIIQAFPGAPIVYMLRDIDKLAASWNVRARALTGTGKWPSTNDFKAAVSHWNNANALALRAVGSPGSALVVVPYEQFFAGGREAAERLATLIRVAPLPEFLAAHEAFASHYRQVVLPKPREDLPGQAEYLRTHADADSYDKLLEIGRRQFAA